MKTMILKCADGKEFVVDLQVAKCSTTIKSMIEDLYGPLEITDDEPIPLPNINSDILKLIIEWATHHVEESVVEENTEDKEVTITPWEQKFLKDHESQLLELSLAANYLDIKRLLDICCSLMANQIRGKTPEEIKKFMMEINGED